MPEVATHRSLDRLRAFLAAARAFRTAEGRPRVIVAYAQSVDGSIASRNGRPVQLSGEDSAILTHRIRSACDAILIGIGTLLADDPRLTVRHVDGTPPQPIVLDTFLRTPPDARLLADHPHPAWLVHGEGVPEDRLEALRRRGALPLPCATREKGKIDLPILLSRLAARGIDSLMVEGGAQVITSFFEAGLADLVVITVSPQLFRGLPVLDGRSRSRTPVALEGPDYETWGKDLVIWADPRIQAET